MELNKMNYSGITIMHLYNYILVFYFIVQLINN